jgi:hypothetical protein
MTSPVPSWLDQVDPRVLSALHHVLDTEGPEAAFSRLTIKRPRVPIPWPLKLAVIERDNDHCRYCGVSTSSIPMHIDHVIPISAGGSDTLDNLVVACAKCNVAKGTHHAIECPTCSGLTWTGASRHYCGTAHPSVTIEWVCTRCPGHRGRHHWGMAPR